jgi:hypothetical protein
MNLYHLIPLARKLNAEEFHEELMSRKRKNKMNDQNQTKVDPTLAPAKEIIGTNPDGSPIYREETVQTAEHTGDVPPAAA